MDKNEFFRQVTVRICGNLEIEEAIQMLLRFLKDVMPIIRLFSQGMDRANRQLALTYLVNDCFS